MITNANEGMTTVALGVRIAGLVLRTLFIGIFVVLVARVSLPLNETLWSAYDTPGDLIRVVVGLVACLWMLFQRFDFTQGCRGASDLDLPRPCRCALRFGVRYRLLVTAR